MERASHCDINQYTGLIILAVCGVASLVTTVYCLCKRRIARIPRKAKVGIITPAPVRETVSY